MGNQTHYERRFLVEAVEETAGQLEYTHISLKKTLINYSINAVIIIFASALLPKIGKEIAHQYGMTETFFGTFFVALSTSLPEIAVSIAAVK
ncbi:MAG: hypothetical protein Q9M89_06535 [Persephonella sp.]|nr:hypothetical protein [Persephonella sp.]